MCRTAWAAGLVYPGREEVHDVDKSEITDARENTEQHTGHHHHEGGVAQFGAGGPGSFLELADHFAEENTSAAERIFHELKFGRRGGNRTPNQRFWRPLLYQLSYTPVGWAFLDDAAEAPLRDLGRVEFKVLIELIR